MQRRNFLQSLMAAAAGLTVVGRAAPAVAAPAPAKPTGVSEAVSITADTAEFGRRLDETQRMVIEMLKECRVTSVQKAVVLGSIETWKITYRHAPDAIRTFLDDEASVATSVRVPQRITVTPIAAPLDISSLDDCGYYAMPFLEKGDFEIEVEWI